MSKVLILSGSVRKGNKAAGVSQKVARTLVDNHEVVVMDRLDQLPFFNEATPPIYAKGQYKNLEGIKFAQDIKDAEVIILVSPEYNHSTSAVLKNAIDWAYEGWVEKPVFIITYGVDGGSHARAHLVDIMGVLGANMIGSQGFRLDELDDATMGFLTSVIK